MTFFLGGGGGETEHFSGKNEALSWSIIVGKQKHNVLKPIAELSIAGKPTWRLTTSPPPFSHFDWPV